MHKRYVYGLSLVLMSVFSVLHAEKKDHYEYWIDNNYAVRVITEDSNTDINLTIDFSEIPVGLHYLNALLINKDDQVSVPYRMIFYVPDLTPTPVYTAYYEYWLDADYEGRQRIETSNNSEDCVFTLDASEMTPGIHFFNIRAVDSFGNSSIPSRYVMYRPDEVISDQERLLTGYRYSFNNVSVYEEIEETDQFEMFDWVFDAPDLLDITKISDACSFAFGTSSVTMSRTSTINFAIQFENQVGNWSTPAIRSYSESDKVTHEYIPVTTNELSRISKMQQGDYAALKIDVSKNGTFYLTADQSCNVSLYKNASKLSSYTSTQLDNIVSVSLGKGTYYALVYDAVKDAQNPKSDVRLRLSTKKNSIPVFGDLNDDGEIDGFDLVGIANFILNENTENLSREDADLNQDTEIDGYDYVAEVNIIMGVSEIPTRMMAAKREVGEGYLSIESSEINAGETGCLAFNLFSEGDSFTLVQTDLTLPPGLEPVMRNGRIVVKYADDLLEADDDHTISCTSMGDGRYRILCMSQSNTSFISDNGTLFSLEVKAADDLLSGMYEMTLSNTLLVCPSEDGVNLEASNYSIQCNGTTGIEQIDRNLIECQQIYTIDGKSISEQQVSHGLYLINGKKTLVK